MFHNVPYYTLVWPSKLKVTVRTVDVVFIPLSVWELIGHVATYGCEVVVESICYLFLVRDAPAINVEFFWNSEFNLLSVHYFIQNRPNFSSIIA